jgi:hypothetical protein
LNTEDGKKKETGGLAFRAEHEKSGRPFRILKRWFQRHALIMRDASKPSHNLSDAQLHGTSGAQALFFKFLNVAAQAATHKDHESDCCY